MTTLLVGFDSAWTPTNAGALVGVVQRRDGTFKELGPPRVAAYRDAEEVIVEWQAAHLPTATMILLDQPTIVKNASGQRPVEHLVGSAIGRRRGGMQPANTAKREMFGNEAPVWRFITRFGGLADPMQPLAGTLVFETYPAFAIVALGWVLPDCRAAGRLPKYNPEKRTFAISDWRHVCSLTARAFDARGLKEIAGWLDGQTQSMLPRKRDQDGLDACLCLLVALQLAERKDCLMIGDLETGYIVIPHSAELGMELEARCKKTGRAPSEWVRVFQMLAGAA